MNLKLVLINFMEQEAGYRELLMSGRGVAWHGLDRAIAPSFVGVVIVVRTKAVYSIYTTLFSSLDLPLILLYQSIRSH